MAERLLGASDRGAAERAPSWPASVPEALRLWPIKGSGTVLFDGSLLGAFAAELADGSKGPLLVPGGAEKLGLPTARAVKSLKARVGDKSLKEMLSRNNVGSLPANFTYGDLLRLSPEVASGGLDLSRVPGIKGEKRTAIIPLRPIGFEAVPRRPAEPQTTVPAPAGVFGAG